jgi:hypothetical protein
MAATCEDIKVDATVAERALTRVSTTRDQCKKRGQGVTENGGLRDRTTCVRLGDCLYSTSAAKGRVRATKRRRTKEQSKGHPSNP